MGNFSRIVSAGLASSVLLLSAESVAYAYQPTPIWIEVNQSYSLPQTSRIVRIAVTNPKVADISIINKSNINVIGLSVGSTSLTVWTANGMRQEFNISISPVDSGLSYMIQKAIGLPHVQVQKVGSKILLRGTVTNQREKAMAESIASLYIEGKSGDADKSAGEAEKRKVFSGNSGGNITVDIDGDELKKNPSIINLLEMTNPDQINIEAMVIETNSSDADKLGLTFNDADSSTPGAYSATEGTVTREKGSHWYSRNWLFTHFSDLSVKINALIEDGRARVISRPNITTMSGRTAGIHIGGKVMLPSTNPQGSTSYQDKDYGIELDLLRPEVDTEGNITATLYTSVSRLDYNNGVVVSGTTIPGIADRTATSAVNIPSGMTMAIGGLLNSQDSDKIQRVPLLGKIPVLGNLFTYHNKTQEKSEIIILITPRIVNESTPAAMGDKVRDAYLDVRHADQARYQVELNASLQEKAAPEKKSTSKKIAQQENTSDIISDDTGLDKYLNREVLKAPSKEEKARAEMDRKN